MSSLLTESPLKIVTTNHNEEQYVNDNTIKRKIEFDKGNPLSFNFCSNKVKTISYTFVGFHLFVWKKMLNSPFNITLIFATLFYLFSFIASPREVRHLDLGQSMTTYYIILGIEYCLIVFEYIDLYRTDLKINKQPAKIYNFEEGKFINSTWKDIRVGNIIKIKKDQIVPADIIILESIDPNHLCFVDTSSINGIFDLFEAKKACNDTFAPSMKTIKFNEYVKNIKGTLKYEEPNSNMTQFNGKLKLESYPRASEISYENFIMRGSTIKSMKFIYGLVVYTGMETKIMQTLKSSDSKTKNISLVKRDRDIIRATLKFMQFFLIGVYTMLLFILFLVELHKSFLCYYSFLSPNGDDHIYLEFNSMNHVKNEDLKNTPFFELFLSFLRFVLTYIFSLPYNYFGIIRIAYMLLSKFIQWDTKVLLNPKNSVEIINKNCIADFGQVRHILTDKTGTLTTRKFLLRICSIKGKMYSFDSANKNDENFVFQIKHNNIEDLEIYQELKDNSPHLAHVREFVEYLCLCHTLKITPNEDKDKEDTINKIEICSCYAEEKAALKMMTRFGYIVKKSKNSQIFLDINNEIKVYDVVGVNRYSDERRRMSVIIKANLEDLTSTLLCKANDFSVFALCKKTVNYSEMIQTKRQIKEMIKYGYRFFIYCKRNLNEEETNAYINKYKSAENYVIKSEEHLINLAIDYEKELEFLGVLFFEEKLSNDLKYTINKLNNNGIKVWIVSGDRKENVVSVGKNLEIYTPKSLKGEFSDKDKPEDLDIKMSTLLMQYLFPNEKINKMKTRKGLHIENLGNRGSYKDLTILISGPCFTRICKDDRNFQSMATLLSYCTNLLAYSFSPNNKFFLCQMIKRYVSKNSKVLAVGDGFNDSMMLKEADLSIGIRSKEILQVRNSCDIIVNQFPQIADLILIHGTWDFKKLLSIALISFYSNLLIIFPIFLQQNANAIGSTFYLYNPSKLSLDIICINLSIIFMMCFDYPIERSIIGLNPNIYKENFFDTKKLVFAFGFEFIKAVADSLITYYFFFLLECVNENGETIDQSIFGTGILYTSYAIIIFKIVTIQIKAINYLHIATMLCTMALLACIYFYDQKLKMGINQGLSYIPVALNSILILGMCYLYEYIAFTIINFLSHDFIFQVTSLFNEINDNHMYFDDFESAYLSLSKDIPSVLSKIDKITYPEVLGKIYQINKSIDPALENMADVTNEEVAYLKIKRLTHEFNDKKSERDFIFYRTVNAKTYLCYLGSMLLFWVIDICFEGFPKSQMISKILTIVYLLSGLLVFFTPLIKYKNAILIHYFAIITLDIISVYLEKDGNDTKICFKPFFFLCTPLLFPIYHFSFIFLGALYYLVGIWPSIYLNDFDFSKIKNEEYFLYSNLPLCYHRNVFIFASIILLMFVSYYSETESRIEFLKYQKCDSELKKDNLIMGILIPEFVREKLKIGLKEVPSGYEVVSIIFCDICDFDSLVAKLPPKDLIRLLDELYGIFDQFCSLHGLQKIESVGKTYMAAGGLEECEFELDPLIFPHHHALRCFEFGIDILDLIQKMLLTNGDKMKIKIGIHTGEVIPVVLGNHKPQFSLIGDTVNTTCKMCSYSTENCITCSQLSYDEIKIKYKDFTILAKEVKGKGRMNYYMFNPRKNNNKKMLQVKTRIPKQSTGNLIMKSLTKKCPVLTKQGTKSSVRQSMRNNQANSNFSVLSIKKNSFDSNRIIDDSTDKLVNNKNGLDNKLMYKKTIPAEKKEESEWLIKKNDFLSNSFLFLTFKNNIAKNGFLRFEKQKFLLSENLSICMNVCFLLNILLGIYQFSQYALVSRRPIALFIIIKAMLAIILIGIVFQTKFVINNYGEVLRWLNFVIFLLITITNQIQMNFTDEEFYLNLALEETLTIITISLNGMLSYLQIVINLSVHICIFIINSSINYKVFLIAKYSVFLIAQSVVLYVVIFVKYYYSTFDFLLNQKKSRTLVETEKMLFNLMPLHVVQNLKDDIPVTDVLDNVTILIADIVNFTQFSDSHKPVEVVEMLCELFKGFDDSTKECSVYKVHTIGDCYVVMGFNGKVPMNERNYYDEARNVCKMADNMVSITKSVRKEFGFDQLEMRIGIHTGPVIAGIIGSSVVRYDIFGSDVLIANKVESSGLPGKINMSEDTKKLLELKEMPFILTFNQTIQVPSIGKEIKCYFIDVPQFD